MLPKIFREFDKIWEEWPFGISSTSIWVPEGYKIVEDPDHKKKRLEQNVESLKKLVKFYQGKLKEAETELSEL